ncbi:helix-turn-helix domain-containing protein [Paenibacillus allorhizosphaerae]|uniref:HTH-type transcriptional activator RhaR n=1 Tax=Paenibacillus allorhizosphaerae TaxID=2849866 RepID=A0ABM8VG00_9BACL|nr:helix-turn-helix domain-containing protein [Paenibacillus allorhizosphaerae]CAG7636660.1 HTH-type transcriptional activator RhaR [Paenibacillus allorhizosphaerae]
MNKLFWVKAKLLFSDKQTKLIVYVTLFVSAFITSVGLFLYDNYKDILDNELNQPHNELLQINLDVTNRAFREADEHAVKVSFHTNTLRYIRANPQMKQESAALLSSYLNTIAFDEDVHSVYVLDVRNKQLVSSGTAGSLDWANFPDQSWQPWVEPMRTKPLLIKRRTLGTEDNTVPTELISLLRPIIADGEFLGIVMVNVDYDRFFSKIYTQLKTPQYIFSLEGDLIYPKLKTEVPLEELYKAIDWLGVRPFGEVKLEGQSYLGNQAFSDMTGWRWVSFIPLEQLLKNVKMIRDIIFLLSLASIIVGTAAIFIYNFAAFKPIKRIRQLIAAKAPASSGSDLHDLEAVVQKLLKEFDSRSSVAERSLPELRSKYVQDVLEGRIGSKELQEKWEAYFAQWSHEPIVAAAVSINRYLEWSETYNEEDQLLLQYALMNVMSELMEPKWRVHCVPLDKENLMLAIQSKEVGLPGLESSVQEDLNAMTQTVMKYLRMSLSVGIGQAVESVSGLASSFEEAKIALANRLYEGYDKTIRYGEVKERDRLRDADAEVWKSEIIGSLDSADITLCRQVLERWAQWIREHPAAPDSVYTFVDGIIEDGTRIMMARGIRKPAELDNYTEHRLKMMDLDDVQELLIYTAEAVVSGTQIHKSTKEYQLARRIIGFIEEHLHEPIGLQDIAEFVNLSTSSVSSLFKMETGFTIYEYLTKTRIDHACKLLSTTDLKIADIAVQVGYQNENSFIRSFRKLKSVTPGKYREANKQGEFPS